MKKIVLNSVQYFFLFLLFFLCLQVFYAGFRGDYIYNYGFSYALSRGEIPYVDFNMIVPPLGPYFYAFFFFLFGVSNIVFNMVQSILLCILFFFCYQLWDKKAYLLIPLICLPFPIPFATILFPGYNFLLVLELVILLYCEKKNTNDIFIGILIGISILTKHTVGFAFLLVSLYYCFSKSSKVWKRLIGLMIPLTLFLFYLLITRSLMNFLDLCVLGMFDFTSKNGTIWDYNFILFLFGIGYLIPLIWKNKKDIMNYYLLAFSMIAIPLFDYYHVSLFLFVFSFVFFSSISLPYTKINIAIHSILFATAIVMIWFGFYYQWNIHFTHFPRFSYFTIGEKAEKEANYINRYLEHHKGENIIFLSANAYFFKIVHNQKITDYDLLNYGNHGYNGTQKMIQKIQKERDPIFIINQKEYEDNSSDRQQINKEIMKYVIQNYPKTNKIGDYIILKK